MIIPMKRAREEKWERRVSVRQIEIEKGRERRVEREKG